MNRRYREIISKLLNAHGCTSVGELALLCNVSIRTIQLDIKKANSLLSDYDITINTTKKGYYFTEKSKMLIIEKDIIRSCLDLEYILDIPTTPFERQMYILLHLTFNETLDIEELANQLFVSEATLRNDMKMVQNWLDKNFGLNVSTFIPKGIKLICKERDKRNIIYWIIGGKISFSTITKYWNYLFKETNPSNLFKETYDIVENVSKKFKYYLTGNSCMMFSLEILIAIRRHMLGYFLESYEGNEKLLPVMVSLRRDMEAYTNVELPEDEWLHLQKYFQSKQFGSAFVWLMFTDNALKTYDTSVRNLYNEIKDFKKPTFLPGHHWQLYFKDRTAGEMNLTYVKDMIALMDAIKDGTAVVNVYPDRGVPGDIKINLPGSSAEIDTTETLLQQFKDTLK